MLSRLLVNCPVHILYFDQGVLIQSPTFFFSSTGAFLLFGFFANMLLFLGVAFLGATAFLGAALDLEPTLNEPIPPEVGGLGPSIPPIQFTMNR